MSALIPRSFINDVLTRTDIVTIINERIALKKRGINFICNCPFHQEKTPSFSVSPSKQIYHCFGCGVGGNAISFLMEFDNLSFLESIEVLANKLGLTIPRKEAKSDITPDTSAHLTKDSLQKLLEKTNKLYQSFLQKPETRHVLDYLKSRGMNATVIQQYELGFAPNNWDNLKVLHKQQPQIIQQFIQTGMLIQKETNCYDRFRNRIMFPIRDSRGQMLGFGSRAIGEALPKYLNSPETILFHKGRELYGLHLAQKALKDDNQLIIVEGYMDVIALVQFGIKNSVATLGTAITKDHISRLLRYTQTLIFCFDGDSAGKNAARRALETLLPFIQDGIQAKFMFLPEGEDPDSYIKKHGADEFKAQLQSALNFSDFFIQHLASQVDLTSIDGRAHLVKLAKPLLQQLPDSTFKSMLTTQLAKALRLDESALLSSQRFQNSKQGEKNKPYRQLSQDLKQRSRTLSPMRLVMLLLIQNPQLLQSVENIIKLKQIKQTGTDLLHTLITLIEANPTITTAAIIEYWRDQPENKTILKLAHWQHFIPATGIEAEFLGAVERLCEQSKDAQIEQLLQKASFEGLSSEERTLLNQLITRKPLE